LSYTYNHRTHGLIFWDTVGAGANPIAPYQIVSYANQTECDAAKAAGCPGEYGDIVIVAPVTAGVATRRIAGVSLGATFSGGELTVVVGGVADVMASAAIATDGSNVWLHAALRETRTAIEMMINVDPRLTLTYQLCMADDTAVVLTTGAGTNALVYPLGYGLKASTAKYDIIPVELDPRIIAA
jgi:hypothetical protein